MTPTFCARHLIRAGLALIALCAITTTVSAAPVNLVSTGRTSPPVGHYEFCRSNPGECRALGRDAGPMQLTRAAWQHMLTVNASVNQQVAPDTDERIYGVAELWIYPDAVGDCEDYVLLKRKRLIERGFSPSNLLITVVLQPNGDGHAVLTVRTDYGDYILDNMRSDVRLWSETGYTFVKRQSPAHAGHWTKLGPGTANSVAAIR
ncbi:transglutaminase-like cysteine peptidase [Pseudohoeflea coraliihabitans]|uniref:Transglutaminase-like cysteine peptidase n=1 Tax=Pseudohoeflea coraliihabitans TaxID=2860393 RepID=A0ABS6WQG3_9HYPH|nr:transglutaminase-like cysteine peptidase [Pseudohoeflea sp. DP4N28-3]MBW3098209.1 transglutaminase-like cysteine peptidase [Pseudohoeflea sp. DP4N28-3]